MLLDPEKHFAPFPFQLAERCVANVDQVILRDAAEVGTKCGLTINRREIVNALHVLVEAGFAKAYDLFPGITNSFSGEIQGMPSLAVPEEHFRTYFYVTKPGMNFHLADGTWYPLDDEGEFRPGLAAALRRDVPLVP